MSVQKEDLKRLLRNLNGMETYGHVNYTGMDNRCYICADIHKDSLSLDVNVVYTGSTGKLFNSHHSRSWFNWFVKDETNSGSYNLIAVLLVDEESKDEWRKLICPHPIEFGTEEFDLFIQYVNMVCEVESI